MKKKLPVFIFVAKNVLGKKLLELTDQTCDSLGRNILRYGRYDCERDCNGIRIIKLESKLKLDRKILTNKTEKT